MNSIDRLTVKYHGEIVGVISLTPDDKRLAFEYDPRWLAEGFSISPLELPLKTGLFLAKPTPLYGDFGIFEDSLPDGYGRYLLHKALMREGIDDRNLTAIERLSIVGNSGMGALTYEPETKYQQEKRLRTSTYYKRRLWKYLKNNRTQTQDFCSTIAVTVAVVVQRRCSLTQKVTGS